MTNTNFAVDCTPEITIRRSVPHMVSLKEAAALTFFRKGDCKRLSMVT